MNQVLEHALAAHGGLERWNEVSRLQARFSIRGALFEEKGFEAGLMDQELEINPHAPSARLSPFTGRAEGFLSASRAWLRAGEHPSVQERLDPHRHLTQQERSTRWDDLDCLYFTCYSMWNYLTTPFFLAQPGFVISEARVHNEAGEVWNALDVVFPANVPTHSTEQTFFFDQQGLLKRLDYTAVGPATHYCFDHRHFDGIVFPTLRRVVKRPAEGPKIFGPSAVLIQIYNVRLS